MEAHKVLHAARNHLPYQVVTFSLPREVDQELEEILSLYLKELGQEGLKDPLAYCLRELTVNAKKANTKRVYFKEKKLDLDNPLHYAKGMATFKEDTLNNIDHYLRLQAEEELYIKVTFHWVGENLKLLVANNVQIKETELTRVYDRIARSRAFESMEEAFSEVLDDSEGAGLGIVILILMLRKLGLSEEAFHLDSTEEETVATLTIPVNKVKLQKLNDLTDEVVKVIDGLPPFPENLRDVMTLMSDPEVELHKIAKVMARDPGLTADLLKYVNSAFVGSRRHIESLDDAVRLVGLQGLKLVLYPYGAHKALAGLLDKQRQLVQAAQRVSLYAVELAKKAGLPREDQGQVQIAGLLHNVGLVILSLVHPKLSDKIQSFCQSKGITVDQFEALAAGVSQAEVGARVAEKWKFPEKLVSVLRYQNQPQQARGEHQAQASMVYLARSLSDHEAGLLPYTAFLPSVLKALKIASLDQLETLHGDLRKAYHHWSGETPPSRPEAKH